MALQGLASAGAERATALLPLGQVVGSVDAGSTHTCGVQSTRAVACWGKDDAGQATAPAGTFRQLTTGAAHACSV